VRDVPLRHLAAVGLAVSSTLGLAVSSTLGLAVSSTLALGVSSMLALALAAPACSSGGGGPAPGFSTDYASPSQDGGAPPAFRSVRGSGAGAAWAVGEAGTAVQLAGYTWTAIATGSTATLGGLAALDVAHAFAVELGGVRVLAWDGRAWAPLGADRADRAAAATFALATNDVWVAGDGVEHWDGQVWSQQIASGSTFTSLSGSFDTDVWAVGPGGVRHYDGHAWSLVASPVTATLAAVWASGLEDVWLVGAAGTVLHGSQTFLTLLASGTTKDLTSVAGTADDDVWVGGQDGTLLHWDGAQWTQVVTPAAHTITALWTALGADVLLVDDTGAVTRFVP
jgi:hypothetical protein